MLFSLILTCGFIYPENSLNIYEFMSFIWNMCRSANLVKRLCHCPDLQFCRAEAGKIPEKSHNAWTDNPSTFSRSLLGKTRDYIHGLHYFLQAQEEWDSETRCFMCFYSLRPFSDSFRSAAWIRTRVAGFRGSEEWSLIRHEARWFCFSALNGTWTRQMPAVRWFTTEFTWRLLQWNTWWMESTLSFFTFLHDVLDRTPHPGNLMGSRWTLLWTCVIVAPVLPHFLDFMNLRVRAVGT